MLLSMEVMVTSHKGLTKNYHLLFKHGGSRNWENLNKPLLLIAAAKIGLILFTATLSQWPSLPPPPTRAATFYPTVAPTTRPPTQQPTADPWQLVVRGNGDLVGMFPTSDGLMLVIHSMTVRKIAPNSMVVASYSSPREITTAACDGAYLAIADWCRACQSQHIHLASADDPES
jgi:hypothetical protein